MDDPGYLNDLVKEGDQMTNTTLCWKRTLGLVVLYFCSGFPLGYISMHGVGWYMFITPEIFRVEYKWKVGIADITTLIYKVMSQSLHSVYGKPLINVI